MKPRLIHLVLNVIENVLDRLLVPGNRSSTGPLIPAPIIVKAAPQVRRPEGRA